MFDMMNTSCKLALTVICNSPLVLARIEKT